MSGAIATPIFLCLILAPVFKAAAAASAGRLDTTVWASQTAGGWRTQAATQEDCMSDAAVMVLGASGWDISDKASRSAKES